MSDEAKKLKELLDEVQKLKIRLELKDNIRTGVMDTSSDLSVEEAATDESDGVSAVDGSTTDGSTTGDSIDEPADNIEGEALPDAALHILEPQENGKYKLKNLTQREVNKLVNDKLSILVNGVNAIFVYLSKLEAIREFTTQIDIDTAVENAKTAAESKSAPKMVDDNLVNGIIGKAHAKPTKPLTETIRTSVSSKQAMANANAQRVGGQKTAEKPAAKSTKPSHFEEETAKLLKERGISL